jgi:hypothetical protein
VYADCPATTTVTIANVVTSTIASDNEHNHSHGNDEQKKEDAYLVWAVVMTVLVFFIIVMCYGRICKPVVPGAPTEQKYSDPHKDTLVSEV